MDSLVRNDKSETPLLVKSTSSKMYSCSNFMIFLIILYLVQEVSTVDGRWCIKSNANEMTSLKGLLLPRSVKFVV